MTSPSLVTRCPHCDSSNVEQMKERDYEAFAPNTWFECRDCERLWSVSKAHAASSVSPSHAKTY